MTVLYLTVDHHASISVGGDAAGDAGGSRIERSLHSYKVLIVRVLWGWPAKCKIELGEGVWRPRKRVY
jgi:hypothetical protein